MEKLSEAAQKILKAIIETSEIGKESSPLDKGVSQHTVVEYILFNDFEIKHPADKEQLISEYYDNSNIDEILKHLKELNYIDYRYNDKDFSYNYISPTHSGRDYDRSLKEKSKSNFFEKFLIPIIVGVLSSLITSLLTK